MTRELPKEELLKETESTWIGESTELTGEFRFTGSIRVFGKLRGTVHCSKGSEIVIMPSGVIEGDIYGDQVIIAGFASGVIVSSSRILVASSGRVVGKMTTPSLQIDFGAVVEAETSMPARVSSGKKA